MTKPVHKCGDCGMLGHHRNSKKCPKVQSRGKFLDLSTVDKRLLDRSFSSATNSSIDSDLSDASQVEVTVPDKVLDVNENIVYFELEEVMSD